MRDYDEARTFYYDNYDEEKWFFSTQGKAITVVKDVSGKKSHRIYFKYNN